MQFQLGLYEGRKVHAGNCLQCQASFVGRPDKRYCSQRCGQAFMRNAPKVRECRRCKHPFDVKTRADANRQYCSRKCSRQAQKSTLSAWKIANPGHMKVYNKQRIKAHPGHYKVKWDKERGKIIEALGSRCIVCGVDNPFWLEVDFKTGTRGQPLRHPRHGAYILTHLDEFRLLCANHHRELSATGLIQGTDITQ